jgi:4-alpha-glucanotransferase
VDEHPNWRRRLPGEVGSIMDAPAPAERMAKLAARRPRQ